MIEIINTHEIQVGEIYEIETTNRHYTLELTPDGFFISGHPFYCGIATRCVIDGSTPGGWESVELGVIRVGNYVDFRTDKYPDGVTTSKIVSITPHVPPPIDA